MSVPPSSSENHGNDQTYPQSDQTGSNPYATDGTAEQSAGPYPYPQNGQPYGQPEYQQPGYPQADYYQQAGGQGYPQAGYSQSGYYQQGYPQPGAYPNGNMAPNVAGYVPKSRIAAGVLGILLGSLGIHRFYLGYVGIGILQIIVTLFTFGIGALWGFIEGIIILCSPRSFPTDARGVPLE